MNKWHQLTLSLLLKHLSPALCLKPIVNDNTCVGGQGECGVVHGQHPQLRVGRLPADQVGGRHGGGGDRHPDQTPRQEEGTDQDTAGQGAKHAVLTLHPLRKH